MFSQDKLGMLVEPLYVLLRSRAPPARFLSSVLSVRILLGVNLAVSISVDKFVPLCRLVLLALVPAVIVVGEAPLLSPSSTSPNMGDASSGIGSLTL